MKKIRNDNSLPSVMVWGEGNRFIAKKSNRKSKLIKNCPLNRITKIKYPNNVFVIIVG